MAVLITDPDLETRLLAQRREAEGDAHDEVWEGLYVMAPSPNNNHQELQGGLVAMLRDALGWDSPARISGSVNISDRDDDWQFNYRCPDVVVYLPGNPARDRGTHWQGGPDFLVEILSPFDRSRDKLAFYGKVGVREALLIDRNPWALEFYRPDTTSTDLRPAERTPLAGPAVSSRVFPLSFRLVAGADRPRIEVTTAASPGAESRRWVI